MTYSLESCMLFIGILCSLLDLGDAELEHVCHMQICILTRWTIRDNITDVRSVILLEVDLSRKLAAAFRATHADGNQLAQSIHFSWRKLASLIGGECVN